MWMFTILTVCNITPKNYFAKLQMGTSGNFFFFEQSWFVFNMERANHRARDQIGMALLTNNGQTLYRMDIVHCAWNFIETYIYVKTDGWWFAIEKSSCDTSGRYMSVFKEII